MNRRENHVDGHLKRIITIAIVVSVALLLGAGSVYGFRGSAAGEGLRETLSHPEKVVLLENEDRSLKRWEVEARIAQMDAVLETETYGTRGNFTANLTLKERIALVMNENRELGYNDIPQIVASITREVEFTPVVGLGYHKPYIAGSVIQNLDRAQRVRLMMEEDDSLTRWEAESKVSEMGPVQ